MKQLLLAALIFASCTAQKTVTIKITRVEQTGATYQVTGRSYHRYYVGRFDTLPAGFHVGAKIRATHGDSTDRNTFRGQPLNR